METFIFCAVTSYYSYKLRLLHELRDMNIYQKLRRFKKFTLQFALKFVINISCFDEEARGCAFHFVEIL